MYLEQETRGAIRSLIPEVDVSQLDKLASRHRLIDIRDPDELTGPLGYIPGAQNVPLERLTQVARDWDRGEPLVLVCRSGNRSAFATRMLQQMGFKNARNLSGGMLAYGAMGMRQAA